MRCGWRWCGPDIEVEGIISLKTGGCPEDCHFCSQSGLFASPVRSAWLDVPSLVEAAKQTAKTGATEFCIVAAVRGPDERLLTQVAAGIEAIRNEVDIQIACSLGMLTAAQVERLSAMGVHRYNHNLETARSFFTNVVTTHSWEERWDTLRMVREAGMEVCCGGILGMGETLEQRAEFAANLAELDPHEVPLNFLNPRPGTPFGDLDVLPASEALKAVAAFRLALPRTMLRFAGGREITLGDLGAKKGILGGINAVIVGNYLTTLGRPLRPTWNCSTICRCRSRRSTPACRRVPRRWPSSTSTLASPRAEQSRPLRNSGWSHPVLRGVRPPHGGAGAPRRLVGQMFPPRCDSGPEDPMSACARRDSDERRCTAAFSRRRAVATVVAGLTVAGALVGALWAWLAPPIHGVVALTKNGERIKAYSGQRGRPLLHRGVPDCGHARARSRSSRRCCFGSGVRIGVR